MKFEEPLYRSLFRKTGGFMLNWPFGKSIRVGDFFALRNGHVGVVGNIYESYFQLDLDDKFADDIYKFSSPVLEPFVMEDTGWEHFKPKESDWQVMSGCRTEYRSRRFLAESR